MPTSFEYPFGISDEEGQGKTEKRHWAYNILASRNACLLSSDFSFAYIAKEDLDNDLRESDNSDKCLPSNQQSF